MMLETGWNELLRSTSWLSQGFGDLSPTSKKGVLAPAPKELFWDSNIRVHTCITKTTPNDHKKTPTENRKKYVTNRENKNDKTL